ncbi:hypothetical protein [Ornithinimicrobium avium]|uniref:Uncharacterized protein n=1 Tax=Ornithinimicrobium avium TaxID=2283195 RepID=A0A345NLB2_9MICO|nr:hypothetical protein [Ornithinimicrobium avium]AXH95820.1 hypothetical protein DV701_06475 [Ornithinimicrobium avium]
MRWENLFADLAAQQEQLERRERVLEVAEHTRAERGQVQLLARLVAAEGSTLRLGVVGVGRVEALLRDTGTDWLLLDHGGSLEGRGREAIVPLAAVASVDGLPRRVATDQEAGRRLGLASALRAVSRDRAVVRVHDRWGDHLSGTIDAVLADHLDLSRHADDTPRRPAAVRGRVSLPYAALAMVRRL